MIMFIEQLPSSMYIAKDNIDPVPSSLILPSAMINLLVFFFYLWCFKKILYHHLTIKES